MRSSTMRPGGRWDRWRACAPTLVAPVLLVLLVPLVAMRASAQVAPAVSPGAALPKVDVAPPLEVREPPPVFPIPPAVEQLRTARG